jgi:hypothetical protein
MQHAFVPAQVKDHITKLAKKGTLPSQIGVILRDSHGIAQVCITVEEMALVYVAYCSIPDCSLINPCRMKGVL